MVSGDVGIEKTLAGRPGATLLNYKFAALGSPAPFLVAHGDSRNQEPAAVRIWKFPSKPSHVFFTGARRHA